MINIKEKNRANRAKISSRYDMVDVTIVSQVGDKTIVKRSPTNTHDIRYTSRSLESVETVE